MPPSYQLIASDQSWIEGEALRQLEQTAALPGMRQAVGLPDLHPGKGYPIGAAFLCEQSLFSLAHGAGRKWKRGEARGRLGGRQGAEALITTALGGRVICEDKELLYDEAPENYKGIERVVADLSEARLIDVIATLRPVLTYKVRRPAHRQPGARKPRRGRP